MATIDELKAIMTEIGINSELVKDIDPSVSIISQGMDSVDYPAFAVEVENRYGITISDSDSLRLKTLNDFIEFINKGK
jgi:acyl carrier protein